MAALGKRDLLLTVHKYDSEKEPCFSNAAIGAIYPHLVEMVLLIHLYRTMLWGYPRTLCLVASSYPPI